MLEVHQRSGLIVWQCGVVVVNLVMIIMIIMKTMNPLMIRIMMNPSIHNDNDELNDNDKLHVVNIMMHLL